MIPEYEKKDAKLVTGIMGMKSHFGMGSKNLKKPSMRAKKKLEDVYYDPKRGYSGVNQLV